MAEMKGRDYLSGNVWRILDSLKEWKKLCAADQQLSLR